MICGVASSGAVVVEADALDPPTAAPATEASGGAAGNAPRIGAAEGLRCCSVEEEVERSIMERIRSMLGMYPSSSSLSDPGRPAVSISASSSSSPEVTTRTAAAALCASMTLRGDRRRPVPPREGDFGGPTLLESARRCRGEEADEEDGAALLGRDRAGTLGSGCL